VGHVFFLLLHIGLLLFGAVGLIISIPLHLIYSAILSRRSSDERPTRRTHVRCPDCKELVRKDATRCKHCGTSLTPAA
jgi:uncharacterized paraquat-inducible protein A